MNIDPLIIKRILYNIVSDDFLIYSLLILLVIYFVMNNSIIPKKYLPFVNGFYNGFIGYCIYHFFRNILGTLEIF